MSRDFSPPEFDGLGRDLPESDVRSVGRQSRIESRGRGHSLPQSENTHRNTVPKTADRRFISGTDAPYSTTGIAATS